MRGGPSRSARAPPSRSARKRWQRSQRPDRAGRRGVRRSGGGRRGHVHRGHVRRSRAHPGPPERGRQGRVPSEAGGRLRAGGGGFEHPGVGAGRQARRRGGLRDGRGLRERPHHGSLPVRAQHHRPGGGRDRGEAGQGRQDAAAAGPRGDLPRHERHRLVVGERAEAAGGRQDRVRRDRERLQAGIRGLVHAGATLDTRSPRGQPAPVARGDRAPRAARDVARPGRTETVRPIKRRRG